MAAHNFENALKMLYDVRISINEYTSALWLGTDTYGKFTNEWLLQKTNDAQKHIYAIMMRQPDVRGVFYKAASIVGSSSVFTLPWDYGKIIQFQDADGIPISPSSPKILPADGTTGSRYLYYRSGNTLVLNKSGVSETFTLKYWKKPRDLTFGMASAGAATSLTLADAVYTKRIDDYYNGMILDNYTDASYDTITDYDGATHVATFATMTGAASDYYGIVPDMPSEFHHLIAPYAAILAKATHPASPMRPSKEEVLEWRQQMADAMSGFIGNREDVSSEDLFCDFDITGGPVPINIGGQGYIIYD